MTLLQRWFPLVILPPLAVLAATGADLSQAPALPLWFWLGVTLLEVAGIFMGSQGVQRRIFTSAGRRAGFQTGLLMGTYMFLFTLLGHALQPYPAWGSALFMGTVFGMVMGLFFRPTTAAQQAGKEYS